MERILLTTTLAKLRAAHACADGYARLLKGLGADFGQSTPINLLTVLKHNGIADALWALRVCDRAKRIVGPLAADFAEEVLPIFKARCPNNDRPEKAIAAARSGVRSADAAAAYWAAAADAADAADAAAAAAYWAAAAAAAAAAAYWAAAAAAYWAAAAEPDLRKEKAEAARACARQRQAEILRGYLLPEVA